MSRKEWSASAEVKEVAKEGLAVFREFRDFAVRGNVVDMAVGIIVGAAFGTVVKSLVSDIITPPFGLVLTRMNFEDASIVLGQTSKGADIVLKYGLFINNVISFLIVSFVVFLVVRQMNRFRKQQEQPTVPTTKECPYCFSTIPIKATRCAHCTSELPGETAKAPS